MKMKTTKQKTSKPRMIEFEETLWRALKSRAAQEGTSVSAILRHLAEQYLRRRGPRKREPEGGPGPGNGGRSGNLRGYVAQRATFGVG